MTNYLDNIEILAGPIVRRCEVVGDDFVVNIWLLTKSEFYIHGYIFPITNDSQILYKSWISASDHQGYKISGSVWANLITLTFPKDPLARNNSDDSVTSVIHIGGFEDDVLPTPTVSTESNEYDKTMCKEDLVAYNLFLTKVGSSTGWESLELILGDKFSDLTYPPLNALTIAIQSNSNSTLRVLHGSCRKFHGDDIDGSVELEKAFENDVLTSNRHNALFFTGDQIYADDVDKDVLAHILDLSEEMFGVRNKFLGESDEIPSRYKLVKNEARMTVDEESGANHLVTLPEFCAMYCMAWNPDMWPENLKKKFAGGSGFRAYNGSQALQRLMANIPTYMIFDDHEITDDFYLNTSWKNDVKTNQRGRRILFNGLLAYAIFQDWGNTPIKYFENNHLMNASNLWYYASETSLDLESQASPYVEEMLEDDSWAFAAPTSPPVFFLNTRTEREDALLPNLISTQEYTNLRKLINEVYPNGTEGQRLLFVTPTPVLGITLVELGLMAVTFMKILFKIYLKLIGASISADFNLAKALMNFAIGLTETSLLKLASGNITGLAADDIIALSDLLEASNEASHVNRAQFDTATKIASDAIKGEINTYDSNLSANEVTAIVNEIFALNDHELFHAQEQSYATFCEFLTSFKPEFVGIFSGDVHYGSTIEARIGYYNQGAKSSFPVLQMTSSALKNKPLGIADGDPKRPLLNLMQTAQSSMSGISHIWTRSGNKFHVRHRSNIGLSIPTNATFWVKYNIVQTKEWRVSWIPIMVMPIVSYDVDSVAISNNFGDATITTSDINSKVSSRTFGRNIEVSNDFSNWPVPDWGP